MLIYPAHRTSRPLRFALVRFTQRTAPHDPKAAEGISLRRGASGKTRRNIVSRMDPEFRPELDDEAPLDAAAQAVVAAGARLADATVREMRLEDERALVKDAGIRHLVDVGEERSATAAEKFIEKYEPYMEHRRHQYDAVRERIVAQAAYDSAVLIALGLTPPRTGLAGSAA